MGSTWTRRRIMYAVTSTNAGGTPNGSAIACPTADFMASSLMKASGSGTLISKPPVTKTALLIGVGASISATYSVVLSVVVIVVVVVVVVVFGDSDVVVIVVMFVGGFVLNPGDVGDGVAVIVSGGFVFDPGDVVAGFVFGGCVLGRCVLGVLVFGGCVLVFGGCVLDPIVAVVNGVESSIVEPV